MNEEIEYAEMLEIPISTVNVVKKNPRRRKQKQAEPPESPVQHSSNGDSTIPRYPLKDTVIAQVNDKLSEETPPMEITAEADLFAEGANSEGSIDFDPIPDRIDTVRLYTAEKKKRGGFFRRRLQPQTYTFQEEESENDESDYELNEDEFEDEPPKGMRIALNVEFALACALCGAIFLTNVFLPNSAINTFFRSINENATAAATDNRTYTDFTLSPVVSDLSDAELQLSPTGILTFRDACCVYPVANGTISEIAKSETGETLVKITYSDTFTGVISGLNHVYYEVGSAVKANVPLGYTNGETDVQVTMYSNGTLLNCFQLTDENCLAWVTQE